MWSEFIGRFHPVVVHLPIGFLILAFVFECLSLREKYKEVNSAVVPALLLGTIFAWLGCLTGYLLRQEGGYDNDAVDWHQYFGLSTAVLASVQIYFLPYIKIRFADTRIGKQVRILSFVPLILVLNVTGHLGGSLTHGEDFLSFSQKDDLQTKGPAFRLSQISNPDSVILFKDVIQPIFDEKCSGCHSSRKQKGNLRLDSYEFISKGGKNGSLFHSQADSSLLMKRLNLPLEDKHHMPPKERPQLSSAEINLIQEWIADGVNFKKYVGSYADAGRVKKYVSMVAVSTSTSYLPNAPVVPPDEAVVGMLRREGVILLKASQGTNYLVVSFTNMREPKDNVLSELTKLRDQVVSLDLGFSSLSENQLSSISKLDNLRVLILNNTNITNEGLLQLKSLSKLRLLNLTGTNVSDTIWNVASALPELKHLYLYNSNVTRQGATNFIRQHKGTVVDTGRYELPHLITDTLVYKRKI